MLIHDKNDGSMCFAVFQEKVKKPFFEQFLVHVTYNIIADEAYAHSFGLGTLTVPMRETLMWMKCL